MNAGRRAPTADIVNTAELPTLAASVSKPTVSESREGELDMVFVFSRAPLPYIYQYLRWDAFQNIDDTRKIALFKKLMYTPIRKENIVSEVARLAVAKDFDKFASFIESVSLKQEDIMKTATDQNKKIEVLKNPDELVELYFSEKDPHRSEMLFEYLLEFDAGNDRDGYKQFIQGYPKMSDEIKSIALSRKYQPNTFF
jgi:hypothetical protein